MYYCLEVRLLYVLALENQVVKSLYEFHTVLMVLRLEAVNLNGEYCTISHYLVIQTTGHIFQLSLVLF